MNDRATTKYLVTGANGQLGYDIVKELKEQGEPFVYQMSSTYMDVTSSQRVLEIITKYTPNVIFHCAAYTNVDKAEHEQEKCYNINVNGTKNIVEAANKVGSKVIYISTDYVFDGLKEGYYETNDLCNPLNYYGYTKHLGELEALNYDKSFVSRVSWLFGINGNNFVKTMLRLAETNRKLKVVNDQFGSPTYTVDLARFLVDLAYSNKYGIYHATNASVTTWYEFAKAIFDLNNINMKLEAITSKEYKAKANRPFNSRLSNNSLIENNFEPLPDWQDALVRYTIETEKVRVRSR